MTTQIPTWREPPPAERPGGEGTAPGTVVDGRYELRTPIGVGGMGTVWKATDLLLRREVAVKEVLIPAHMPPAEREALCERTLREARAAAALSHPSVVQVYDVVSDGDRPWIVMELLEARSLADIVIEDGPMSQRAVAKIGIAMLGALEVAHAAGVLHRDVKPANVLICPDGRCVLTDFGVARLPTESKLTTPGMVLGSPHFISPERAVGGAFGPPSDLFSLGVTLYTAVEGGPPFDRGDPFETMRAVVEEAPRVPRLAGVLAPVILGLLEKEPARRWSVDRARATLRELLAGPLARPASRAEPATFDRPLPRPGPRVGGRAMLDPDEPLSGQLVRRGHTRELARGGARALRARAASTMSYRPAAIVSAGAGVTVILVIVAVLSGWFAGPQASPAGPLASTTGAATPSPSSDAPLIPVQQYQGKGISVNVPQGWTKATASSYVDFTDPAGGRKIRINVESTSSSARRFLQVAASGLRNPSRCPAPYTQVGLRDIVLAQIAGAELEYTCGTGTGMRHGLWAAIVVDGSAYHFYLTVPDSQFLDSRIIYEEMVRSFRLV